MPFMSIPLNVEASVTCAPTDAHIAASTKISAGGVSPYVVF